MKFFNIAPIFCDDGSDFYFVPSSSVSLGEAPKCERCGNCYGMLPLIPPVSGVLVANKRLFDLSATTGDELLVSERCLEALKTAKMSGLETAVPIDISQLDGPKKLQKQLGRYYVAEVKQWGAEIDRAASALKTSEATICPVCGYAGLIEGYERICVSEGSWKGHDVFTLKGLHVILVTQRVADLCHGLNLSACSLVPAELAGWDSLAVPAGTPINRSKARTPRSRRNFS